LAKRQVGIAFCLYIYDERNNEKIVVKYIFYNIGYMYIYNIYMYIAYVYNRKVYSKKKKYIYIYTFPCITI